MNCDIKDFQPFSAWRVDVDGEKFEKDGVQTDTPKYIIDESTGHKYLNDSNCAIRFKCICLSIATPLFHTLFGILNVAYRIVLLISCYQFCSNSEEIKNPTDSPHKNLNYLKDGLRVVMQPFAIVGLEIASIFGIFFPQDGRKIYASIERAQYEDGMLAPCFQPNPKKHLLGGDLNVRDQL